MEKRMKTFKGHEMGTVKDYKELLNRAVEKYGDKVAFKYKKDLKAKNPEYVEHTFKDYKNDVTKLGTALLDMGLEGKKVALIGRNRYEWCVTYMAVACGNMIIVPLDRALPNSEIKSLISRSEAEAVIYDEKYEEAFDEIKKENNTNLKYYICMDNLNKKDILYYQDLLKKGEDSLANNYNKFDNIEIDNNKLSVLLYTSGTTSVAKAVMLCQNNVCSNINAMPHFVMMYETDSILSFLPLHHTFECTISFIYGCLYCGATLIFCDGLKYILDNLKEYHITVFVGVPQMLELMYKKLTKAIEKQGKTKLINVMSKLCNFLLFFHIDIRRKVFKQILDNLGGKLRLILYGGAPMDKPAIIGLSNFGISINQGYGLTETSPVISAETDHFKKPGATGLVMCNEEAKIYNPNDEGIGEIIVKGPNIMLGYYKDEEATKEAIKDGWFYTGDLGYIDKEGFLYITGRKKDLIVLKNGKNVYPLELEFLISKLPFVEECMVFGMPKDGDGKDPVVSAKIVYNEETMKQLYPDKKEEEYRDIIWEQVKEINQNLSTYKHIKEIIVTTEPLVKTTTQKVKRAEEMKKILAK